ncbi:SARP family transcriptional regulator [Streptomyces nojiriensis]|uniref:SARP family transcriptional regulator n=2 Tax=Streptomyces nojiriensis TaxID=66374 RepID=A0ABQ3SNJ8_9ACTN|nr:BTAD domain-containing putative transcriptional regulator [Streptomyces nojiriensis]GGS32975.1 SARP family transcriptional regulator [Streptomyces nojiriensis]GHI69390.1 SARP family transcriptional regulator [Streptomyces nojiriensis]
MQFRVLGPVSVTTANGGPLPLGPAKRRSLLAMLLAHPNTPVGVERLTEALWDEEPPRHARTVLQGHVSRLRAVFAQHDAAAHGVELLTQGAAYRLRLPETLVDAHRFEESLRLVRRSADPGETVAVLREALGLWQGPAFDGTVHSAPLEARAHALEELRLTAVEALASAYGQLGDHGAAASVLRAEAAAHPLREPLVAQLMLALARAGRQADALDWFHRTRKLLADEIGVDPAPVLTGAYNTLLRTDAHARAHPEAHADADAHTHAHAHADADHGTARPPAARSHEAAAGPAVTPQLLPRRPRGFIARQDELDTLDRITTAAPGPIVTLTGSAGVGKTALAVHWSHRRRADFPDGTLFADLCGFSPTPARDTRAVLREFLLALGVPVERMPGSPAALGARYRELTAGRRLLVVLDNAVDSEQIRPLLPGGDECVTLVTSRDRLDGLVATDAARPVTVGTLPAADSTALLAAVLGPEAVAAEPEAAARLAGLCDGLPLALRVAAARLATRPHRGLASFAGELADEQHRLDLLKAEDTGVAAALGLSLRHLPEPARWLFHHLGPHTGATLDTCTAAALADCPPPRAALALDQLAAAQLVVETGPQSYVLHDLVRLFARSLAPDHEPAGLLRLLDHWVQTLLGACAAAEPGGEPCCALPPGAGRTAEIRRFADRTAALAWYSAERGTLRATVEAAVAAGLHDRAWRLVLLQWPLIVWQVRDGWVPLLEQGLASAELDGDPAAQSRASALLGWVLSEEGRPEEALTRLERAPDLAVRAGDFAGEAVARINLAVALMRYGDRERPGGLLADALALAEREGLTETATLAHQHLAQHLLSVGAAAEAAEHAARGLALAAPLLAAPRRVVLRTLHGEALAAVGRTGEAVRQLHEAIREARADAYEEGEVAARVALDGLAEPEPQRGPGPEWSTGARGRSSLGGSRSGPRGGSPRS